MRDLKYSEAFLGQAYRSVMRSLKTEAVRAPAENFIENIDRISSLHLFPLMVAGSMLRNFMASTAVSLAMENEPGPLHGKREEILQEAITEVKELLPLEGLEQGKAWNFNPGMVSALSKPLSQLIPMAGDTAIRANEAVLSAMVIGTWTAFETLAGDLWTAAVNSDPKHLAPLGGSQNRIHKATGLSKGKPKEVFSNKSAGLQAESDSSDADRKIPLKKIQEVTKGSYNLSQCMGNFLISSGQIKFSSLWAIRASYSLAFSENTKGVRPVKIDAALALSCLDQLSQVRNVLVHNAGRADADYLKVSTSLRLPRLEDGQRLQFDGVMVKSMVLPVIRASTELLKAVDSWLRITMRTKN